VSQRVDGVHNIFRPPSISTAQLHWRWQLASLAQPGNGTSVYAEQLLQVINSQQRLQRSACSRINYLDGHSVLLHLQRSRRITKIASGRLQSQLKDSSGKQEAGSSWLNGVWLVAQGEVREAVEEVLCLTYRIVARLGAAVKGCRRFSSLAPRKTTPGEAKTAGLEAV
jgi:hypothetical protein